jgi:histone H3/H4
MSGEFEKSAVFEEIARAVEKNAVREKDFPLTEPAFREVQKCANEYLRDLMLESARTARRHQSEEAIESNDVRQAARYLTSLSSGRRTDSAGVFGGLLAGGGIGNFLQVATVKGQLNPIGVAISVLCVLVGAVLITYQIVNSK